MRLIDRLTFHSGPATFMLTAVLAGTYVAGAGAPAAGAQAPLATPAISWVLRLRQHPPTGPATAARRTSGPAAFEERRWPEKVLYSFSGPDGSYPNPLIRADDGSFYGTTSTGGANPSACGGYGCGTVFQLTPPSRSQPAWTETLLYSFAGGTDGANPYARVTLGAHGVIYGTTSAGGASNFGTVFQLTPPPVGQTNWTETVLYAFTGGADGGAPEAPVTDLRGSLYGTTFLSGTYNVGTAFRLSPPKPGQTAWAETVIHAFGAPNDGAYPFAGFTQAGNALFSTASGGGHNNCPLGCGIVYELTPKGPGDQRWRETILHEFNGFDGASPGWEPTLDSTGALYATTDGGGAGGCAYSLGCGTAVKLTPPLGRGRYWTSHVIFYFSPRTGYFPGAFVADGFGNIYGEAASGGALGYGLIVRLSPHGNGLWKETILHRFSGANGAGPWGELTIGAHGNLYGVTYAGGNSCACGVAFELKP